MMDAAGFWQGADAVGRLVALVLLGMSVVSRGLIGWKAWLLRRARRTLSAALPVFWSAPDWSTARTQAQALDPEALLIPLLDASQAHEPAGSLAQQGPADARLTRALRGAGGVTARAFLVALACALVPAAPARAVERPAPRSAVTRLLGPAMAAVVRAARRVVSPAPSRARAVLRRSMPRGRRAWRGLLAEYSSSQVRDHAATAATGAADLAGWV